MNRDSYRDGNSAAGVLLEVFAVDMTSAIGTCDACGSSAALAEARIFDREEATVLHCRSCDSVLLKIVEDGSTVRLDLRGLEGIVVDVATGLADAIMSDSAGSEARVAADTLIVRPEWGNQAKSSID